ncbi:MAG: hypothetical protein ACK5MJ_04225 [Alphaproteobacteria bacterium]
MKKLLLLSIAVSSFSFSSYAYKNIGAVEHPADQEIELTDEMKAYLPNRDMSLTFKDNPLKFLEAIQLDYHFSSVDQGLSRIKEALDYVEPIYNKDKNEKIFPEQLVDAESYKVYSGLLTLEGMLLMKKAFTNAGVNADNDDPEGLRKLAIEDMQHAGRSLEKAVEVDADSAEAYFQLGKYYHEVTGDLDTSKAEKAFSTASKLAKEQDNEAGSKQALAAIRELNPESKYLEEAK